MFYKNGTCQKKGAGLGIGSLAFIVVLGLILAPVCGCGRNVNPATNTVKKNAIPVPGTIQLKQKIIEKPNAFPYRYFYFPEVSQILDGNPNGELVGLLWADVSKKERRQLQALYLIDPARKIATKIAEPRSGFEIYRAALDDKWVVWVEKTETTWKLSALNRTTKETKIIDEGEYFKEGGPDYPSPDLYNGMFVYDTSLKAENNMISRIIAKNLNTGERIVLGKVEGSNQYLGPPKIYENHVVWHRGEWTKDMRAEVYLYNLADRRLRRLSAGNPAITPVIWGKYVVWNTYQSKSPENKNIVLYNLETGASTFLTKAARFEEYWEPSIGYGIVTWNANVSNYNPVIYVATTGEKRTLEVQGSQIRIYGPWLAWHSTGEKDSGTFLLGLDSLSPVLDITGPAAKKALTKPPFSLDTPLTPQRLAGLTPPEIAALYLEAVKEQRYDVVSTLLADETGLVSKEEYIADMKRDRARLLSYSVSCDYLIQGEKAYICILEEKYKTRYGTIIVSDRAVNWHMTKQEGFWKVDQLAAQ